MQYAQFRMVGQEIQNITHIYIYIYMCIYIYGPMGSVSLLTFI